jgi:hypothetical protein
MEGLEVGQFLVAAGTAASEADKYRPLGGQFRQVDGVAVGVLDLEGGGLGADVDLLLGDGRRGLARKKAGSEGQRQGESRRFMRVSWGGKRRRESDTVAFLRIADRRPASRKKRNGLAVSVVE